MRVTAKEFYQALFEQANDEKLKERFSKLRDECPDDAKSPGCFIEVGEACAGRIKRAHYTMLKEGIWDILPAYTPHSKNLGVVTETGDIYSPYIHRRFLPAQVHQMLCAVLHDDMHLGSDESSFPDDFDWKAAFQFYKISVLEHLANVTLRFRKGQIRERAFQCWAKYVISADTNYLETQRYVNGAVSDEAIMDFLCSKRVEACKYARGSMTALSRRLTKHLTAWLNNEFTAFLHMKTYGGYESALQRYFFDVIDGVSIEEAFGALLYTKESSECAVFSVRNLILWYTVIGLWGFGNTLGNLPDKISGVKNPRDFLEKYKDVQIRALREQDMDVDTMDRYAMELFKLAVEQVYHSRVGSEI